MRSKALLRRKYWASPKDIEMELCNYLKGKMSQTEGTVSTKPVR